jgi:autotransporter-associated beta strand protein
MNSPSICSRLSVQFRIRLAAILNAVVFSLGADDDVEAATKNWSGNDNNDSNWTSNLNWDGVGGASANDDLVFPGGASRLTNNNNFNINTNFNSLDIKAGSYQISGAQIFLANGITANFSQGNGNSSTFNPNIVLGANQTWTSGFGTLTMGGVINLNNHNLIVTGTFGGNGFLINGSITGTGTLAKSGGAQLTIAGNASGFSGSTTMSGGSMLLTGSLGPLNLQGGTFRGTGTVDGIQGTGGKINPGTSGTDTGVLTCTGASMLDPATTLVIDVNGTNPGTDYDQLLVTGANIDLNGANLEMVQSFATGDFIPNVGDTFTIVSQTGIGSISGQFQQGGSINVHGQLFFITYSPSSVTLTAKGQALTWDGGGSTNNWNVATNWDFDVVPGNAQSLTFPAGVPADSLTNTNNIVGLRPGTLTFTGGGYDITGNLIELATGITSNVASGNGVAIETPLKLLQAETFLNNGGTTTTLTGQLDLTASGFILTVDGSGNQVISGQIVGTGPVGFGGIVKNGTGTLSLFSSTANTYTGQTLINNGTVRIGNADAFGAIGTANNTIVASGATLILESNVSGVPEGISLSGDGVGGQGALNAVVCNLGCSMPNTSIQANSTATINVPTNGHSLTLSSAPAVGLTKIGTGTLILGGNSSSAGTATVNAGTLIVNGSNSNCAVNVTGGALGGGGSVGSITVANGTVAPGQSAGTLSVSGNVTFNAGTTFSVEIGGLGALADKLSATGTVTLGAGINNLRGSLINGFAPTPGQTFTIIQSTGALTGTFTQGTTVTISGTLFQISYLPNSVLLTAQGGPSPTPTATATATPTATATATATASPTATPTATAAATATATPTASPTPTPPNPTGLANVSTRMRVETGDNALIGGFIITGTEPKKVIVLAIGPSLGQFFPGPLANPTLELFQGNTLLESNDNWVDSPKLDAILASTLAPRNNLESAIIRTLPANNAQYTAVVRGVSDGTGVGVVQVFDLDRSVDSKLANIATRGLVQTGDDVMIGGFIVLGATPQQVIVIALGPSLPVTGKLANPTLELRDGNGALLDANDDWVNSPNQQAINDSGVAPTDAKESAIIATLPSNGAQFTAIVRGVNNTTGVAVVEVFALQ